MKKSFKIVLIGLLLVAVAGYFGYRYVYHSERRDVQKEAAAFTLKALDLHQAFVANTEKANATYLEKATEVSGTVTAVEGNQLLLDEKVVCISQAPLSAKVGAIITVKGRVIGYDDFLDEIKMDQCTLIP